MKSPFFAIAGWLFLIWEEAIDLKTHARIEADWERVGKGFLIGSSLGFFQNPYLIAVPAAIGILIVLMRNKRKKIGQFSENTSDHNV